MTSAFLNWSLHVILLSGVISIAHILLKKMNFRATNRYMFLQATFLTLPLLALLGQFQIEAKHGVERTIIESKSPVTIQLPLMGTIKNVEKVTSTFNLWEFIGIALMVLYVLFVIFQMFKVLYSYRTLRRIHKNSRPMVVAEDIIAYIHQEELSPAAFGFFNPVILIPQKLVNDLSESKLQMTVLHENEHIKRFDPLFNIVRYSVTAVTFFSPFTKWLSRQYEEEMEISIDESLITTEKVHKKNYGNLLVDLCLMDLRVESVACNGLSKNILERRVLDMKRIGVLKNNKKVVLLVIGLVFSIGASVPVFGLATKKDSKITSEKQTFQLDDFLVNLSNNKEPKILKVTMGFETSNAAVRKEIEDRMMQVRDIVIILLSSKELGQISTPKGKERMKVEIRDTLNSFLRKGKIENVYFPSFIYS